MPPILNVILHAARILTVASAAVVAGLLLSGCADISAAASKGRDPINITLFKYKW